MHQHFILLDCMKQSYYIISLHLSFIFNIIPDYIKQDFTPFCGPYQPFPKKYSKC